MRLAAHKGTLRLRDSGLACWAALVFGLVLTNAIRCAVRSAQRLIWEQIISVPDISPESDILSTTEKIECLQRLWDQIASAADSAELADEQRQKLNRRLEAYRKNPEYADARAGVKFGNLRQSIRVARYCLTQVVDTPR